MTRGRGKVRAGTLDFSALEGCAGFRGHPSPVRTAHIPSFLPHAGVSWLPLFRFSVTSEFPHRSEALASGSATPWAHGPRGPHPHPIATPTSINRAGVLWGGGAGLHLACQGKHSIALAPAPAGYPAAVTLGWPRCATGTPPLLPTACPLTDVPAH